MCIIYADVIGSNRASCDPKSTSNTRAVQYLITLATRGRKIVIINPIFFLFILFFSSSKNWESLSDIEEVKQKRRRLDPCKWPTTVMEYFRLKGQSLLIFC